MKNINHQNQDKHPQVNKNKARPENKDNLDSREGEEQQFKGDDSTHNQKEHKSRKTSTGKKEK